MEAKKPRYRIDEWGLSKRSGSYRLIGRCENHEKWLSMGIEERRNAAHLTTSKVIRFDFNARIAETANSIYELGSIDSIWSQFLEEDGVLISSFNFDEREV